MKIATVILNRNLPTVTDALCESLIKNGTDVEDIFVLEAGSEQGNLSKFCTWYVRDHDVIKKGLRYSRGMNQALINIFQTTAWNSYDAFLLLTNDTEFSTAKPVQMLAKVMEQHPRIAILSPCSKTWGEKHFLVKKHTKYFWSIGTTALMVRRKFIDQVSNQHTLLNLDFLFDGTNFRGYLADLELVAKCYINDWAAAITSKVIAEENNAYLIELSDIIKSESHDDNLKLYLQQHHR